MTKAKDERLREALRTVYRYVTSQEEAAPRVREHLRYVFGVMLEHHPAVVQQVVCEDLAAIEAQWEAQEQRP